MKNFKTFGIAFIALFMTFACEKSADNFDQYLSDDELKSSKLGSSGDKMVTVPFKANFFTEPPEEGEALPEELARECEGLLLNIQLGGGEATHLGEFTTRMTFCMDMSNHPEGPWPYYKVIGTFVAANGDTLNIRVTEGLVEAITDVEHPFFGVYPVEFHDEFYFEGGTGRFEGATGGGDINSLSNFAHTDHNWTGTLTLPKGPK